MTTTPPADLADLEALDVDALDGEQLAIYVAMTRGYQWHVGTMKWQKTSEFGQVRPRRFLQHPERIEIPNCPLWDGKERVVVAADGHRFIPRPDRDEKAAVQLLCEILNKRCNDLPFVSRSYPENIGAYRLQFDNHDAPYLAVGSYRGGYQGDVWGAKQEGDAFHPMTSEGFCLLVCRAYLKAWQAERKAENESA